MSARKDAERAAALERLRTVLAHVVDGHQLVPCLGADRDLWISDNAEDQEAAAHRCLKCPALTACWTYVQSHAEPAGVWAGLTPANR